MITNPLVQEWLDKAEDDWLAARTLLREDVAYGAISFHAQQVAEKCVKAYLTAQGKAFPRTHDLLELLAIGKSMDESLSDYVDEASLLNPVYLDVRYPGGEPQVFDQKTAQDAFSAAETIRSAIFRRLNIQP